MTARQTNTCPVFIITLLLLFIPCLSFTEIKTFEKEYTYQASESDSKLSSRTVSLREVKRLLLEELGTYLESITEVQGFRMTKDQITTLTAGIVRTEIVEERWDGKTYWLRAKIVADPESVAKSIGSLRHDRQKIKELEDTQKRADALLKENERLKKELETAKGEIKARRQEEYAKGIKELSAIEWFEKGYSLGVSGNYNEAINAFARAISLNPKDEVAYVNRGTVYGEMGDNEKAIKDFDRAIALNPEFAVAYANRGLSYNNIGKYQQAIRDYNRAIAIDPNNAVTYNNRGTTYSNLGNFKLAIKDYDKAISLNPELAVAYRNRGIAYDKIGNRKQANNDNMVATVKTMEKNLIEAAKTTVEVYSDSGMAGLASMVQDCYDDNLQKSKFYCIYLDIASRYVDQYFIAAAARRGMKFPKMEYFDDKLFVHRTRTVFDKMNIKRDEMDEYVLTLTPVINKLVEDNIFQKNFNH